MSRIRGKNTLIELRFRKALWNSGLRYRLNGSIVGKPDLFFEKQKVAVFVDGCFWHGCPLHCNMPRTNVEFWLKKIGGNVTRDKKIDSRLRDSGWKVIRLWEHEIEKELDACVMVVREIVGKH